MKSFGLVSAVLVMCAFCVTAWGFSPEDVIKEKQSGNCGLAKVYPVTRTQAWEIAQAALRWGKSNRLVVRGSDDLILTSFGIASCPCRTEVGIWVEPVDPEHTKVTIITKGRVQKNVFTNLETFPDMTGPEFQKWFETGVEIVKRGEKLPHNPPKN